MEAEEIGTTLILPEQDSQDFITLSNSMVKPFTTAESETPDLSKGNKNPPLCKRLIEGLSQNGQYPGPYCSNIKPMLAVKDKHKCCFGQRQRSQSLCL